MKRALEDNDVIQNWSEYLAHMLSYNTNLVTDSPLTTLATVFNAQMASKPIITNTSISLGYIAKLAAKIYRADGTFPPTTLGIHNKGLSVMSGPHLSNNTHESYKKTREIAYECIRRNLIFTQAIYINQATIYVPALNSQHGNCWRWKYNFLTTISITHQYEVECITYGTYHRGCPPVYSTNYTKKIPNSQIDTDVEALISPLLKVLIDTIRSSYNPTQTPPPTQRPNTTLPHFDGHLAWVQWDEGDVQLRSFMPEGLERAGLKLRPHPAFNKLNRRLDDDCEKMDWPEFSSAGGTFSEYLGIAWYRACKRREVISRLNNIPTTG